MMSAAASMLLRSRDDGDEALDEVAYLPLLVPSAAVVAVVVGSATPLLLPPVSLYVDDETDLRSNVQREILLLPPFCAL